MYNENVLLHIIFARGSARGSLNARFRYRVGKTDERIPFGPTAQAAEVRWLPARRRRHSDRRGDVPRAAEAPRGGGREGGARRGHRGHERFVAACSAPARRARPPRKLTNHSLPITTHNSIKTLIIYLKLNNFI